MTLTPDPVDVEIGRRICSLRSGRGYNQSQLGRSIGVTFQQVQKYEKGANRVSGSMLYRIANFLSVEPAYFFPTADASGQPEIPAVSLGAVPNGHELARLYVGMDHRGRSAIIGCARSLAGVTAEAA